LLTRKVAPYFSRGEFDCVEDFFKFWVLSVSSPPFTQPTTESLADLTEEHPAIANDKITTAIKRDITFMRFPGMDI
jgi:hypothetical protein